jgi:hypothetical protein
VGIPTLQETAIKGISIQYFGTITNETAKNDDLFLQFHFFYLYLQGICASAN